MLKLVINGREDFDEETSTFLYPDKVTIELEHSLVSLSKWEYIHEIPFLSGNEKTIEQVLSYISCMIINDVDFDSIVDDLTQAHVDEIHKYMDSKHTATWFSDNTNRPSTQVITSELIYYWMNISGIEKSYETWHLNNLFTLLRVHSSHNAKQNSAGKKTRMGSDEMARRREENARRMSEYGSKG